jgi:alpha-tubulin suppressor-like RCC1 family protein/formylglycine-generating enzyme required for sulfatase activity
LTRLIDDDIVAGWRRMMPHEKRSLLRKAAAGALIALCAAIALAVPARGQVTPPAGMVVIPAGTFLMGENTDPACPEACPEHLVYVSAFYMDATEVTKGEWDVVAAWASTHGYDITPVVGGGVKGPNHPVWNISWYCAVKWANAKSEMAELTPAYYTDSSQTTVYRAGDVDVDVGWVKWDANGYRLPTEAEWERAVRGGYEGLRFPWGNTISFVNANYHSYAGTGWGAAYDLGDGSGNGGQHPLYSGEGVPSPWTSPVGSFAPNAYGLYDVSGNLYEWVWDIYDANYYQQQTLLSPSVNPHGPSSAVAGIGRILRGGGWLLGGGVINRVDYRLPTLPTRNYTDRGFRLVVGCDWEYTGDGSAYTTGSNCSGQLGHGDTVSCTFPSSVSSLLEPVRAVAGPSAYDGTCRTHSLFLLEDGGVYACGYNASGALGRDNVGTPECHAPLRVDGLPDAGVSIAAGDLFSLVALENGDVYSFGNNWYGELGHEVVNDCTSPQPDSVIPQRMLGLPGSARWVSAGHAHSLVLLESGDVYGAGWNGSGPLGQGTSTERVCAPVKVLGLPGRAMAIAAAELHSLVVLENGDVYAFGENYHGQLGLDDTEDRLSPVKVPGLPGPARAVAGGQGHSLFLLQSGEVYACGLNASGQLGQGDTANHHTVVKVQGLPGRAIAVAAGEGHSLVLLENGDVYVFGENCWSQLGLGDTVDRLTPTLVGGVLQPARALAAGRCHSLFVRGALSGRSLPAPFDISASDGTFSDRVVVAWDEVQGAASYAVHRATGAGGAFTLVASAPSTSHVDTDITRGQVYSYRIASCDSSGCGTPSPTEDGSSNTLGIDTAAAFRVTSSGDVFADGPLYSTGRFLCSNSADVAEWAPVSERVEPGDVLELDATHPGSYRLTQTPCSSAVAGVVSTEPGVVLGGTGSEGTALLALSGIVPVKVTNEGGPIRPGDLLVSSSTPGYAMRWAGPEPCPCALVGKALGPMTDEQGVISVLLTAH